MEGWSQKEKEFTDMDNSVGTVAGGRWVKVEEGIRWTNGNGKNRIQDKP